MEHFKATLTYNARIDGEVKTLKENYLHFGVNYTDVEAQIAEVYKSRMKRHDTKNIGKIEFTKILHLLYLLKLSITTLHIQSAE